MPDTPLNPDALEAGAKALFMRERKYHTPTKECPVPPNWEDLTDTSMEHYRGNARAVLAAALPDADELLLVTIKLPKNPEHDPRNKKTGACEVSQECTDLTGEHHTVAVRSQKQVEALRDQFGHITRVERVDMNRDDLTAALPEVTSDVYTVAIKNTEKSTGRVFFDYPGCTPEIGTLDDARELLNWVNEGTPSSPDSPYSSEARIYKLTEVNDA